MPPLETCINPLLFTVVLFAVPPLETNSQPLFTMVLFAVPPLETCMLA